ncbi:hypothetical protein JTE90_018257 [Oedothorax gibbosus]|uniref:Uncharacterized protein n=1 Tax=Oedothorax gibbosus TaxID=931172 RepID=A0AAV6UAE0_9ARAC|nr:hypothetical protein JTE90_018257 [Oedothorax gibbosus]
MRFCWKQRVQSILRMVAFFAYCWRPAISKKSQLPYLKMDAEYLLLLDLESESDDDSDSEAIALCHELRQRRFWVADYIKRREDLGEFRLYYELDDD